MFVVYYLKHNLANCTDVIKCLLMLELHSIVYITMAISGTKKIEIVVQVLFATSLTDSIGLLKIVVAIVFIFKTSKWKTSP